MRSFKRLRQVATTDEQMKSIRDALVAVIASGAMDAIIRKDLLKEEWSEVAFSNIYALLKRYGIAASDIRSENSDPAREVLKRQQDNLKRASLRNKSQQLQVKQAQVQSDIQKVATDIAKVGQRKEAAQTPAATKPRPKQKSFVPFAVWLKQQKAREVDAQKFRNANAGHYKQQRSLS